MDTQVSQRIEELSQELMETRASLTEARRDNQNLRENWYDCESELSKLEAMVEKREEQIHLLRGRVQYFKQQQLTDAWKIIHLQNEVIRLYKPFLRIPETVQESSSSNDVPPTFMDDDVQVLWTLMDCI